MTPASLPDLFSYRQALEAGMSRADLESALLAGQVQWLRRGWYALPREPADGERWEIIAAAHLERLRLELARRPGHVASHASAALLHGLAVFLSPDSPVHLTSVDRIPRSRREDGLVIHHSDSLTNEVEVVEGLRATTLDRTVADYLRTQSLPVGLGLMDEGLRHGRFDVETIRRILDRQKRWRGRPRALGVLELADPVRESWAESYTFGQLHLHGVPMPLHQAVILGDNHDFVGRVDGLWPRAGVVGECDGEEKYRRVDHPGTSPEEHVLATLEAERARQERMERLGLAFVRWSPAQVREDAEDVARRVKAALAAGDPYRFRGWVVHQGERHRLPLEVETPKLDLEALRRRRPRAARRRAA